MSGFESKQPGEAQDEAIRQWREAAERRRRRQQQLQNTPRAGYLVELSGEPIVLEHVEYRLLEFLTAHPYKAFTRRQIADAITSQEFPVAEESVDIHVRTLRDRLGLFSDYVQSVPYIGYRFKE